MKPMSSPPPPSPRLTRRRVLQLGAAGAVVVGGSYAGVRVFEPTAPTSVGLGAPVGPGSAVVAATEAARHFTGTTVTRRLTAAPVTVDLGGRTVSTWAYDGTVPGPEIRVNAGDRLAVTLVNGLPDPTTVHWHGVALRNDMDGVPGLTMDPVAPGGRVDYAFTVPDPGTYWFHPHVGIQLDMGMQAALIVADPHEPGGYDEEVVLVLDDWTDGWGDSPQVNLDRMRRDGMRRDGMRGGGMNGMSSGMGGSGMGGGGAGAGGMGGAGMGGVSASQPLGADTGDVVYPAHLINGRVPRDPVTVTSVPGHRIRFRLINAGGDTAYRFAVGGHRLTVTHADGFPVVPVEVDTLLLGMGERYDVVVTVADGAFPIVAVPEGKGDPAALAVLRSASGPAPVVGARPVELGGRLLSYADLAPTASAVLPAHAPDREHDVVLGMADGGRRWLINGATFADHQPLLVAAGERVALTLRNQTMMFHPMHLHGHTFAAATSSGPGVRKDTIIVAPMQTMAIQVQADNPGQWMVHCHNAYHAELGMMDVLSYQG
jgi:FtsP/CotA-like multicopper oxidase with cupredoxin domain